MIADPECSCIWSREGTPVSPRIVQYLHPCCPIHGTEAVPEDWPGWPTEDAEPRNATEAGGES